jgi:predicted Co/Zn/Cd cation transporter (cation efflux family)
MRAVEVRGRLEQNLLLTSVTATLVIAAAGIVFGIVSGSFSILFDGVYALIDATMGGLALLVTRLILRDALKRDEDAPGRVRHQFGFWHLEPMVLALNSTLLTLAVLYALASALILLSEGGTELEFDWAIVYAVVVAFICFFMAWWQRRQNARLGSMFVALDAKGWIMSGAITTALLIAFVAGRAMTGTIWQPWQPYVDPAILALVCLVILPLPFGDLRRAVSDMFLVAPRDLDERVTRAATDAVAAHGFADAYTYVARVGRSVLIEIHFLVPPGWPVKSVAQLDAIRDQVGRALGGEGPNRWLTICFTEDADWAF